MRAARRGPRLKLLGRDIQATLGFYKHPPCFTSEDWRMWSALNMAISAEMRAHFCTDCTPAYQDEMIQRGRCINPTFEDFEA